MKSWPHQTTTEWVLISFTHDVRPFTTKTKQGRAIMLRSDKLLNSSDLLYWPTKSRPRWPLFSHNVSVCLSVRHKNKIRVTTDAMHESNEKLLAGAWWVILNSLDLFLFSLFSFSVAEMKRIYRGFKTECPSGLITEESFHAIYSRFFPHGGKKNKTGGVINDPLGQTHSHASSKHCFCWFCFYYSLKSGDGRTDGRTTCAKTIIPTSRDFGLAEWIHYYLLFYATAVNRGIRWLNVV